MGGRKQIGTGPVTLYEVMQEAIGSGLQKRYQPEKEIPHGLLVLMMQINENRERDKENQE